MPLQNFENQEISGKKNMRSDQKPGDYIEQISQSLSSKIVYLCNSFLTRNNETYIYIFK